MWEPEATSGMRLAPVVSAGWRCLSSRMAQFWHKKPPLRVERRCQLNFRFARDWCGFWFSSLLPAPLPLRKLFPV